MGTSNKIELRSVELSNSEVSEILNAIEMISGIHLEKDFELGLLRKTLSLSNEIIVQMNKDIMNEFTVYRTNPQTKQEEGIIPASKQEEFQKRKKALNDKILTYKVPSFSLDDFKPDPKKDKDEDMRNRIPNGFTTRMMPIFIEYQEMDVEIPDFLKSYKD